MQEDPNTILDYSIEELQDFFMSGRFLSEDCLVLLLTNVVKIIEKEPNILHLHSPISVCGDIHGQMLDLFQLFATTEIDLPKDKMLFLGDYVDRGYSSINTFAFLAFLKVKFPDRVYLLRGNHETRQVNQMYGLYNDCLTQYGHSGIWFLCNEIFDALPLCATIDKQIFCVHGGISPSITLSAKIPLLSRRQEVPPEGPISDFLWSDPADVNEFCLNHRGAGYTFGPNQTKQFNHINKYDFITRSHQLVMNGYLWQFDDSIVTVWSAPNYMYRSNNQACVMKVKGNGEPLEFPLFEPHQNSSIKPDDCLIEYFV